MCHKQTKKPSKMLALIAALIVRSYDRSWLPTSVEMLAASEGVSHERLSRIKARILSPLEALVDKASRRGRPQASPAKSDRVLVLEALLAIAASLLVLLPIRNRSVQNRLVSACERLKCEHGLSAKDFCDYLGLKHRTFRSWRNRPAAPEKPKPQAPAPGKRKKADRGEGRFDLGLLLPGVQAMADTTDMTLLGIPLKFIATQDPGNRFRRLFEGFEVFTQETAREVVDVIGKSLTPGMQLITDQGTPYLAGLARQAYEELELDHAPQKEGTPTAKATLERAFGIVKQALKPLLELTNRLADKIPELKKPELACPLGQLLVALFLRVYIAAAKPAAHPLENASPFELELIALEQRDQARQEEKSKRLFLEQIHDAYAMEGSKQKFVRAHRHHALEDLKEAERRLRDRACRCQTRACDRYFAGILRNVAEENRARRARIRQEQLSRSKQKAEIREIINNRNHLEENPQLMLSEAFDMLAVQWLPEQSCLYARGHGLGSGMIKRALILLTQKNPWLLQDQVGAVWTDWKNLHDDLNPRQIQAMEKIVFDVLKDFVLVPSMDDSINVILKGNLPYNKHSPPS